MTGWPSPKHMPARNKSHSTVFFLLNVELVFLWSLKWRREYVRYRCSIRSKTTSL